MHLPKLIADYKLQHVYLPSHQVSGFKYLFNGTDKLLLVMENLEQSIHNQTLTA